MLVKVMEREGKLGELEVRAETLQQGSEQFQVMMIHRRTNGGQPSKTIVTNACLTQKPSENHRFQWLPLAIPFNGDG